MGLRSFLYSIFFHSKEDFPNDSTHPDYIDERRHTDIQEIIIKSPVSLKQKEHMNSYESYVKEKSEESKLS
jgi:hypothetical protein